MPIDIKIIEYYNIIIEIPLTSFKDQEMKRRIANKRSRREGRKQAEQGLREHEEGVMADIKEFNEFMEHFEDDDPDDLEATLTVYGKVILGLRQQDLGLGSEAIFEDHLSQEEFDLEAALTAEEMD